MSWLKQILGLQKEESPVCSVVVAAAGSSSRMKGEDKLLLPLGDAPVIIQTLRAIDVCPCVKEVIVVTREDLLVLVSQLCRDFGLEKVRKVVRGGQSRTESVYLGLQEIEEDARWVAVHDGARPFVTPELVERVLDEAVSCGAAAPAVPVKDTIKRAEGGIVKDTPDRAELFAVQTPQVFDAALLQGALKKAMDDGAPITDDCSAVERLGGTVRLVEGDVFNLKLTTPEDLLIADGILDTIVQTDN